MEKLTHWKKEANPNYLGSWDLSIGADANGKAVYKEVIAKITKVEVEDVADMEQIKKGNTKATKEELVVYFDKFQKPMIIHAKTNFKGLETATGTPFIELWVGKEVCIYVETGVKAFGITTDALRIKSVPKRICDICGGIISNSLYEQSMAKYGMALCSKECAIKAGKVKE